MSKKITELDLSTTVDDNDLLINQTPSVTKAVKFSTIKNIISSISDSKIGNLVSLATGVKDTIVNAINSLKGEVDENAEDISTNANNISTLSTMLETHGANIESIESDVDSLQTSVTNNTDNIGIIASELETQGTSIETIEGNVSTLQTGVATNVENINTLTTTVSGHTESISSIESDIAELQTKSPDIATTTTAGTVKPDGETITVDADGTIHGASQVPDGVTYVDGIDSEVTESQPDVIADSVNGVKFDVLDNVLKPYTNNVETIDGIILTGGTIKGISDSLTSIDTTTALSSNGGKLLKEAIDDNTEAIGTNETNIGGLQTSVGNVASLTTTAKTVVPAINELKTATDDINSNLTSTTISINNITLVNINSSKQWATKINKVVTVYIELYEESWLNGSTLAKLPEEYRPKCNFRMKTYNDYVLRFNTNGDITVDTAGTKANMFTCATFVV